ncbi:discoidin domain-containing protein [Pedobacter polaris]|uniref:Discoidin domain-containing protein n=1 Tax=Pedobacter polaris TaxID=2571273 RepID=A0A4U1CF63_9SPHI|nr:discoidin domain-containing protein [Pedobacter polaris]TKC05716.1 discoidin domain-containing protein [Pedobacter polaris]
MKNILFLIGILFLLSCKKREDTPKAEPTSITPAPTATSNFTSDQKYNLNVVYFVPSDLDTIANYEKRVSELLLMGQKFYHDEMTRNGYPGKTFGLLTNNKNRVKIITIRGTKLKSQYPREGGSAAIVAEINAYFAANPSDQNGQHTLILLPPYGYNADGSPIDGPFYGIGKWCYAMDYEGLELKYIGTSKFTKWYGGMMHELGHGLNLPHNCAKVSETPSLGTALMGAGNYTLSVSKTFLTATDCAILNSNEIFNKDTKTYYGSVTASIKTINASYDATKSAIVISGEFISSATVKNIIYYNDPNVNSEGMGANKDYNAVSYESKPVGTNGFSTSFLLSDLQYKGNTPYELRIGLVNENGTVSTFSYLYKFENDIPVLDFSTRTEINKQGWSISEVSSEETSGEGTINGKASKLIDNDLSTYWHSRWSGTAATYPHQITIDMGNVKLVEGISLSQRNTLSRSVKSFEYLTSSNGIDFVSAGNFELANSTSIQYFKLPNKQSLRYIKIIAKSAYDGSNFAALAEIGAF